MSTVLVKLFNYRIKKKYFQSWWKVFSVCPVYKNASKPSSQLQYRLISLLIVISKLSEDIINKKVVEHLKNALERQSV